MDNRDSNAAARESIYGVSAEWAKRSLVDEAKYREM
jgi:hypothetical protein